MPNVLVTGGAGFIGSNLVRHWRKYHPGDRLVVIDRLGRGGRRENLAPLVDAGDVRLVEADIRDLDRVVSLFEEVHPEVLIHLAAETHVDRSISSPLDFVAANVQGTATLLEAARRCWLSGRVKVAHRFHHVSTDEVFGSLGPRDPAVTEQAPYRPRSPYSATKAAADHLVRAWAETYGLQSTLSYSCNNYGPWQDPEKLIPRCVGRVLQGRPVPVYGDGSNVRDWLHVADHCLALDRIVHHGAAGRAFNVSADQSVSNLRLVETVCRLLDQRFAASPELSRIHPEAPPARGGGCAELIQFVADRPAHDQRYAISAAALTNATGFQTGIRLEAGLAMTVDWYLANAAWLLCDPSAF